MLVLEMENSEFKPVKLCLKIDLKYHPVCVEGFGKYIYILADMLSVINRAD